MVTALRTVGLGGQMNVLELAMNRAAERAAAEAAPVFGEAIARLTIADAADVRRGPEDALARTLRDQAGPQLAERFTPIVDDAMRQVGLVQAYDQLVSRYTSLPDFGGLQFDLADYVTRETVDGLLVVLAEEERRIRSDPAARSSELLREVFGSAPPRGG